MTNQNAQVNMIKQQLRTGDVLDDTILQLFTTISREEFVPPNMRAFAFSDMPIPLPHDQYMLTPLDEGRILQNLMLCGNETVLEVGTGTGYLTALLSRLCKKVISVEYFEEFTRAAGVKLEQHHCSNVELITGDASCGWLDKAPYDVIIMSGAIDAISDTLRLQVLPGGKLFTVEGKEPAMKAMLHSLDHNGNWTDKRLFDTCIPPLINKFKPKKSDFQDFFA